MSIGRKAKEYFTFNKKEKRAILILSFLIFFLAISPKLYLLIATPEKVDSKKFESAVKIYYAEQNKNSQKSEYNSKEHEEIIAFDLATNMKSDSFNQNKKIFTLFSFDPNTATEQDFAKLGLEPRTIKSIINYRNKGGQFKMADDFKKIYTLSEEDFNRLKSFIVISQPTPNKKMPDQKTFVTYKPIILDINLADSIEWDMLPGIGSYTISKILKYKNALGGFYNINQIAEVYGMKPETFDMIKEKIKCDAESIDKLKKLNLNTATNDELNAHPYINSKQAKIIINFRTQHGAYNKISDLENTDYFSQPELDKLKPYLSVN